MRLIFFIIYLFLSNQLHAEIVCKTCKFVNIDKIRYCEQCGKSLAPIVLCPECAYENNIDDQYCLNCSAELIIPDKVEKQDKADIKFNELKEEESTYSINDIPKENEAFLSDLPELPPLKEREKTVILNEVKYILYIDNSESFLITVIIDDLEIEIAPYSIKKIFFPKSEITIQVINKPGFAPFYFDLKLEKDMQNIFNPDRKAFYEIKQKKYSSIQKYNSNSNLNIMETIENKYFFIRKTDFGFDMSSYFSSPIQSLPEKLLKINKVINDFQNTHHALNILMQEGMYYDIPTIKKAVKYLKEQQSSKLPIAAINILSYPYGWEGSDFVSEVTNIILENWSDIYCDSLIQAARKLNIKDGYFQSYAIVKILLAKKGTVVMEKYFETVDGITLKNLINGLTFPINGVTKPSKNDARQFIPLLLIGIKSNDEETRQLACEGMGSLIRSLNKSEIDYTFAALNTLTNEDFKSRFSKRFNLLKK